MEKTDQDSLLLLLALLFAALLLLAVVMWAIWVRPFVKKAGARTSSPYNLAALVVDFSTSLIYSRGRLPLTIQLFGFLLMLLLSDLVFLLIVFLFVG